MIDLPTIDGGFEIILADPPWHHKTWTDEGRGRCPDSRQKGIAARHYDTMGFDALKAMPVKDIAASKAALFMWVVDAMIPEALELGAAWGFTYKTAVFTWIKLIKRFDERKLQILGAHGPEYVGPGSIYHMGMGLITRRGTEQCLVFTRGQPVRTSKSVRQLIVAPVREHSRKPDEIYDLINVLYANLTRRVELFARTAWPGWTAWGNEVEKFSRPQEDSQTAA